jgi:hypothetical protein
MDEGNAAAGRAPPFTVHEFFSGSFTNRCDFCVSMYYCGCNGNSATRHSADAGLRDWPTMNDLFDLLRTVFSPSAWGIPGVGAIPDEAFIVLLALSVSGALILDFFIPHRTYVNGLLNSGALFFSGLGAYYTYNAFGFRGLDSVVVAAIVANVGMMITALLIIFFSRKTA